MNITAIIRDKTDLFYERLAAMNTTEKMTCLEKLRADGMGVKIKCGNGSFRDRVEANQLLRTKTPTFKLEPRKGYRLATFEL